MAQDPAFHRRILENMTDGVITVDLKGKIVTLNPAAAEILGVEPRKLLDSTLAEHFFGDETNDDFNQVILDAVYQEQTTHNRIVAYNRRDGLRWLSVTTSFLRAPSSDAAPTARREEAGREGDRHGIIILIDDVTDVEALRKDLEGKHRELQTAYRSLEERNTRIEDFTRRARMARYLAAGLVVVLVLAASGYGWLTGAFDLDSVGGGASAEIAPASETSFTVVPGQVTSAIRAVGTIEPGQIINVVSPFDGVVAEKHFRYGNHLERNQVVLTLNTDDVESRHRDARSKYIKAEQQLRELKNWQESPEVVRAQRSVLRERQAVQSLERKLSETKTLLDKGIVAAQEYTNLQEQLRSQQAQLEGAVLDLDVTLAKGGDENVHVAELEFENARDALNKVTRELEGATVRAPVSGIAIMPAETDSTTEAAPIEVGAKVTKGAAMFAIADLEAFAVESEIDEIDIGKVSVGQHVRVTGDAFADHPMSGEVVAVSSQAGSQNSSRGLPKFPVTARIDTLTPEHRRTVRIGMSAFLEIQTVDKPDALIVPADAVHGGSDDAWVLRRDPATGSLTRVEVIPGLTTVGGVEILGGLQPGDVIIRGSPESPPS